MAYEFDLKKFLAQNSNIDKQQLMKALSDDADVSANMTKYLEEIQQAGFKILNSYLTEKEANMLVAMIIGQTTHFTMEANPSEIAPVMALITQHKDLLFTLVAAAISCGVGMSAKEEWR